MSEPSPQTIAGYRLEQRVAVGGMAEIYRAVRSGPGEFAKTVALKTVLPELARDEQFIAMFLEEARLAARIASPHLVQVFDFGEQQGRYYIAMEYVDGLDLAALLAAQGPLPLPLALHLGRQLCAALVDLHGALDEDDRPLGIVHRDVSPGNLLLSLAGDVKLGDLGIARAAAPGLRTERGAIKGKLAYLSPEQARGDELDQRSDIYGVGLVLYEALTGQRYLDAVGDAAMLRLAQDPPRHRPSRLRPAVPPALDALVARALAPVAADRYADAGQLDAALVASGQAIDPATARRDLGVLVRRARQPDPPPAPTPAARSAGRPVTTRDGAPPAGRVTEVLDAAPAVGSRGMLLIGLSLAVGLVAAITVLSFSSSPVSPEAEGVQMVAAAPTHGPDALAAGVADIGPMVDAPAGPMVDAQAGPEDGSPRTDRDAMGRARRRRRLATATTRVVEPSPPPTVDAATSRPHRSQGAPAARLRELRTVLEHRGLLPADLPQIFATLDALQRGPATEAEVAALARRIAAVTIDRAFVDAKLGRLNRRIATAKISAELQQRLRQRAARALSRAVTGRYTEANRELNAIARIIERP